MKQIPETGHLRYKVEGIDELKIGQARLEEHMEGMKELIKGVKVAEQKTEKTENRFSIL